MSESQFDSADVPGGLSIESHLTGALQGREMFFEYQYLLTAAV